MPLKTTAVCVCVTFLIKNVSFGQLRLVNELQLTTVSETFALLGQIVVNLG